MKLRGKIIDNTGEGLVACGVIKPDGTGCQTDIEGNFVLLNWDGGELTFKVNTYYEENEKLKAEIADLKNRIVDLLSMIHTEDL